MKTKILWLAIAFASIASAFGQPVITSQPQDQTNYASATATFTVAATGTETVTYQWQWDRPSTNFTDLLDETNATLTISGVQTNDAANYRAVVTDATGSTNSAAAHLYVNPLPILFVSQSSSGQITLSWQDTNMVLLEADAQSLGCAAWVRVADTSPATFPIHNDTRFFRLAALSSISEMQTAGYDNLTACRRGDCKACEEFVASYFMLAPLEELAPNAEAEEAADRGIGLGSCVLLDYQAMLGGIDNGVGNRSEPW